MANMLCKKGREYNIKEEQKDKREEKDKFGMSCVSQVTTLQSSSCERC